MIDVQVFRHIARYLLLERLIPRYVLIKCVYYTIHNIMCAKLSIVVDRIFHVIWTRISVWRQRETKSNFACGFCDRHFSSRLVYTRREKLSTGKYISWVHLSSSPSVLVLILSLHCGESKGAWASEKLDFSIRGRLSISARLRVRCF